tara:strand:+ start:1631 stop:2449 length:819 start_codon:yes stop_codon:yes gene_type:complete
MAMDFFSSDRSTFSRQVRLGTSAKGDDDGLFLWSVLIVVLTALTAFSWIFCMYVFGHPEKAFSYNLLTKLEKIEGLKDYAPAGAPRGKFNTPRDLYNLYYSQDREGLRSISSVLRREYVTNYVGVERVTYIRGDYRIYGIRELGPKDVFPSGLALRGQSEDFPNVVIEYVIPAASLPEAHFDLQLNRLLQVGTSSTCAAVINISRVDDDRICFTAVPIVYGAMQTPAGTEIAMAPPKKLNLFGRLPITKEEEPAKKKAATASAEEAESKTAG